jgi:hypothetical protein
MTDTAAGTGANAKTTGPERRSDLDVMGVVVVLGLVFFHSALILADNDALIRSEPPSMAALAVVAFASLWGMPLMFLISSGWGFCLASAPALAALILTIVLYDIGVRRIRVVRFLFGVKERNE